MTSTTHTRRGKLPNPGEREGVLAMLAKANAAGRNAPPMGSKPYDPPCRTCAKHAPTKVVGGVRTAYPCPSCGAVRG